jgi:hypothetical protein
LGSQPVSIRRHQLPMLKENLYLVTEKTDGFRYLLLLTTIQNQPCSFFIGRNLDIFQIPVTADRVYFDNTILDGELVRHRNADQAERGRWTFWVFDCLAEAGVYYGNNDFLHRHKRYCTMLCVTPDSQATPEEKQETCIEHFSIAALDTHLSLVPKPFFPLDKTKSVWEVARNRPHGVDGLIFVNVQELVQFGTQRSLFKFKDLHTVDLELVYHKCKPLTLSFRTRRHGADAMIDILTHGILENEEAYTGTRRAPAHPQVQHFILKESPLLEEFKMKAQDFPLDRMTCIVEAEFLPPPNGNDPVEIHVIKIRQDKSEANNDWTTQQTLFNVVENMRIEEIYAACGPQV